MAQTIDIDGETLHIANLVRRGAALAVDLCVAVLVGSILFWVISLGVPLDAPDARGPVLVVVLAAAVYLIWARDHILPSPGRRIFALLIVRPGVGTAAALSRPITVYRPPSKKDEYNRAAIALLVVGVTSLAGLYLLAFGLKSTTVYQTVARYTLDSQPFATEQGTPPLLGRVPRALLVGKRHAYVQTAARWGGSDGSLEFFLEQSEQGWRVVNVRMTEPSMHGRFAISVPDDEVPRPR